MGLKFFNCFILEFLIQHIFKSRCQAMLNLLSESRACGPNYGYLKTLRYYHIYTLLARIRKKDRVLGLEARVPILVFVVALSAPSVSNSLWTASSTILDLQ